MAGELKDSNMICKKKKVSIVSCHAFKRYLKEKFGIQNLETIIEL